MANFSGKLSYNDGNVAASSAPLLLPPAADCRQEQWLAASHNSRAEWSKLLRICSYFDFEIKNIKRKKKQYTSFLYVVPICHGG